MSQSETPTPAVAAVAATVNACEHRSGSFAPAVTLITSAFVMALSLERTVQT